MPPIKISLASAKRLGLFAKVHTPKGITLKPSVKKKSANITTKFKVGK